MTGLARHHFKCKDGDETRLQVQNTLGTSPEASSYEPWEPLFRVLQFLRASLVRYLVPMTVIFNKYPINRIKTNTREIPWGFALVCALHVTSKGNGSVSCAECQWFARVAPSVWTVSHRQAHRTAQPLVAMLCQGEGYTSKGKG